MNVEPADAIDAARPLLTMLGRLGLPHYIGGSLATTVHGTPRSTIDADLVVAMRSDQVDLFFDSLDPVYFSDLESIRQAVKLRDSFNLLHLKKLVKIDVFVLKQYKYEQQVIDRVVMLPPDPAVPDDILPFCSAEDIILNKLMWYDEGGRVSERQWLDLLGVARVQWDALDRDYLTHWAGYLDVTGLLEKLLAEAAALDGR